MKRLERVVKTETSSCRNADTAAAVTRLLPVSSSALQPILAPARLRSELPHGCGSLIAFGTPLDDWVNLCPAAGQFVVRWSRGFLARNCLSQAFGLSGTSVGGQDKAWGLPLDCRRTPPQKSHTTAAGLRKD
jgi:hypothetical protein